MNVFLYADSGEFLGPHEAQPSPLEPGQFLLPPNATTLEPPQAGDNQVAIFADDRWSLKPDFRGIWYQPDGVPVELEQLDELPKESWTRKQPEPLPPYQRYDADVDAIISDLAQAIAWKRAQIEQAANDQFAAGVTIRIGRRNLKFDCDRVAQQNIVAAVNLAQLSEEFTPINWALFDNSLFAITTMEHLLKIAEGIGARVRAIYEIRNGAKLDVSLLTDVDAVEQFVIPTEWNT